MNNIHSEDKTIYVNIKDGGRVVDMLVDFLHFRVPVSFGFLSFQFRLTEIALERFQRFRQLLQLLFECKPIVAFFRNRFRLRLFRSPQLFLDCLQLQSSRIENESNKNNVE